MKKKEMLTELIENIRRDGNVSRLSQYTWDFMHEFEDIEDKDAELNKEPPLYGDVPGRAYKCMAAMVRWLSGKYGLRVPDWANKEIYSSKSGLQAEKTPGRGCEAAKLEPYQRRDVTEYAVSIFGDIVEYAYEELKYMPFTTHSNITCDTIEPEDASDVVVKLKNGKTFSIWSSEWGGVTKLKG